MDAQGDVIQSEIERLREENAALKERAEAHESGARHGRLGGRDTWARVLAVAAAAVLTVSVSAVWINRVVLDTDAWVSTVAPLATDPAIQDALSAAASNAIIEQLDSRAVVDRYLPESLTTLAGPISQAVDNFIREQTDALVRSDQFAGIWEETNRAGHAALVAAVTGRQGTVSVEAGTVTLDTGLLAERVKAKLAESGLGFADRIPTEKLSKQIVLYESPLIAQLSTVVDGISKAALVLPVLGLALAAGAFGLAIDRRKVALWLGVGIVVAGLLPLQAIYLGQYYLVSQVQELASSNSAAAQAIYTTVFRDLIAGEQILTLVGAVVWLAAVLAGPARWAVALRGWLSSVLTGAASHVETDGFETWVAGHRSTLRTAGFVGAAFMVLAVLVPRTSASVVWVIVGAVVWLLGVEFLGRSPKGEGKTDASDDGVPATTPPGSGRNA